MVQAIINLSERENKFLNIYKAENSIKSKNEAIKRILREFEEFKKYKIEEKEILNIVKEHKTKYKKRKMSKCELDNLLEL